MDHDALWRMGYQGATDCPPASDLGAGEPGGGAAQSGVRRSAIYLQDGRSTERIMKDDIAIAATILVVLVVMFLLVGLAAVELISWI